MLWRKAVFIILVVYCLSPLGSPAAALILGIGMALLIGMPFPAVNGRLLEVILGLSVALLAFGTDLTTLYSTLKSGFAYVVVGVTIAILFVYGLGTLFKVKHPLRIATLLPPAGVSEQRQLTAYLLINAVLLAALPFAAAHFGLTADQISMWTVIAIPDVAAGVGVPQTLGHDAVNVAVPLILAKVLLMSRFASLAYKRTSDERRAIFPWFIPLYIFVAVLRTYAPVAIFPSVFDAFVNLGMAGVILSLFLLGTRVERRQLPANL